MRIKINLWRFMLFVRIMELGQTDFIFRYFSIWCGFSAKRRVDMTYDSIKYIHLVDILTSGNNITEKLSLKNHLFRFFTKSTIVRSKF